MHRNKGIKLFISLIVLVCCLVTGRNVPELFTDDSYGYQNGQQNDTETEKNEAQTTEEPQLFIERDGTYTSKEEVAAYLYLYQELPSNFITKEEAKKLGWVSNKGNLHEVAPGKSIGGDYFGNFEGNLPEEYGRDYYECDINYDGGYRGDERIVYSDDGLIYYTEDHYETFEQLYGEE